MSPSRRQLAGYGGQPADPARRPVLFVNPRSGGGKAGRAGVAERARDKGIEAVILAPGQDLAALAREAVTGGADALGMAGGGPRIRPPSTAAAASALERFLQLAGESHGLADSFVDRLRSALGRLHDRDGTTNDSQRRIVGPWTPRERLGRGGNATFAHSHDSGCTASQYGTGLRVGPDRLPVGDPDRQHQEHDRRADGQRVRQAGPARTRTASIAWGP